MMSCVVNGCTNNSMKNKDPSVHYYDFPKHPVIARQWLIACGWNSDHEIDTNSARVCSIHFDDSCYTTEVKVVDYMTRYTKTLKYDAIPTEFIPTQIIMKEINEEPDSCREVILYTVPSQNEEIVITQPQDQQEVNTSTIDMKKYSHIKTAEQLEKLLHKNEETKKCIREFEEELVWIKQKLNETLVVYKEKDLELNKLKQKLSRSYPITNQDQKALLAKTFSESQIKILCGKKKIYWSNEDMAVAFTLRHLSNKRCYVHLKKNLNIPLPAISSMKRWMTLAQQKKKLKINKEEDDSD